MILTFTSWPTGRSFILAASLLAVFTRRAHGQELPSITAAAGACDRLKALNLPGVRWTEVADVRDSAQRGDNVRGAHCRVSGVAGKDIAFVVMLPNEWNQRLLMGGNGGYAGTINRNILTYASSGYLTVSTNTGHEATPGGGARWALNDLERQVDFGYAGIHRAVEVARALGAAFYGSAPKYSYFTGCSNGGRQALMEVQRFPEDFDGVIAGAPAAQSSRIQASFLKNLKAVFPDSSWFDKPFVTQASLDYLSAGVLSACDALDGVKDGILDDPRDCRFQLSSLKSCVNQVAASDCLTSAQRSAIEKIYGPTKDEQNRVVYPGQPLGGENLAGGWARAMTGRDSTSMRLLQLPTQQSVIVVEGAKYMMFSDSTWNYSRYTGSYLRDAMRVGALMDADNTDIAHFTDRGGKLLLWHGWSDPMINPLGTIEYYEEVQKRDSRAREHVRLFLAPGVLHCGGGPGMLPGEAEFLRVMREWVEKTQVPDHVIAARRDSAQKVVRSRPVCAYPRRAVYSGSGSTDDAANFVCKDVPR